jgi:hypothetical protein
MFFAFTVPLRKKKLVPPHPNILEYFRHRLGNDGSGDFHMNGREGSQAELWGGGACLFPLELKITSENIRKKG